MTGFALLAVLFFVLAVLLLLEWRFHRLLFAVFPIRIHVNGSRGKSSVTRLIAAGLNAGGIRTVAKTTGTMPRLILPDGDEMSIFRPTPPNVIEQVRMLRRAKDLGASAVVFECMALQPHLQVLSEDRMLRATHTVVTNIRPDHLEVMGPTEKDVALAIAGSVCRNGHLFLADIRYAEIFTRVARERQSAAMVLSADDVAQVSAEELAKFSYLEHAENIALALAVCERLGVARQSALAAMWKMNPDPGVLTVSEIDFFGRRLSFYNGFAANDPESTRRIWNLARQQTREVSQRIILFNSRADRPERSLQFARALVQWPKADTILVMGTGAYVFLREARRAGIDPRSIELSVGKSVQDIFEELLEHAQSSALVVGMGNIAGMGLEVVRFFRNRAELTNR